MEESTVWAECAGGRQDDKLREKIDYPVFSNSSLRLHFYLRNMKFLKEMFFVIIYDLTPRTFGTEGRPGLINDK
jgi:hypothetical protein